MKNQILIFLCFLFYQAGAFAQQDITVKGTVIDVESGLSIAGVNVLEKGTANGTMTDFDGTFTLVVKPNVTLEISYIGYATQEIAVNGQTQLEIKMKAELSQLEEVIVVGYGTVKKSDLTGSVTRANIERFRTQPNTSIAQSLQGTVAGLNVGTVTGAGGSPSISVRGRNSLSGSTNPLIVLDGVIYRGSIIDINQADVKSVDVLRDASSKAIYGSQAANGVVIITTKTGKKAQKPSFTLSTYYTTSTPTKHLHPLDREGYIAKTANMFWEEAFNAPDYTTPNPAFDPTAYGWTEEMVEGYNDGTNTNWLDLVTQNAFIYNTNLSMSGSTNKTTYFLSGGYTEEDSWAINDTYNKINLRANFESEVVKGFKVGMQTFMSTADFSGVGGNLRNAMIYSPLLKVYDADGELTQMGNDPSPLRGLVIDDFDKRLNLFGNFYATLEVPYIKGLKYKINYSTNYRTRRAFRFDPNGLNFAGSAFKSNSMTQDQTLDNQITYVRTFGKHDINVTAVYGFEARDGEDTNASSGDFINPALGYNSLESGNTDQQRVSSGAWDERSHYQMGRLNYKFDNKYLATFTIRRDGFSGFGSNKKFGTFPSVAVAWVASNEGFVRDALPWANQLKLKATYGSSGNRTLGRYGTLASVSGSFRYVFGDGGSPAYGQRITSLANNDLGWETTTGINLGLEFGFLNNRINGEVAYYKSKTEDLLYNINIPRITGFGSIRSNIGEIENNGLEITLNSTNVRTDDFEWNSSFVFSKNTNKIVSILGTDDDGDGVEDDIIGSGIFIGESIGTIYDYVVDGIYQLGDVDLDDYPYPGNYIVRDDIDGEDGLTGDDRQILGHTEPAYRFSVFNEFKYKNWSVSAFINSIQGGKDGYLGNNKPKTAEFGWQAHTMATFNTVREFNYWTPSNPNAEYSGLRHLDELPSNSGPNIYRDRSFIRLQDVSLSYTFPKSLLEKMSIDNLRLFLSGKNLHTWTKWKGVDPEAGIGFQPGSYPVMKSYTFGLNLTF